MAACVGATWIGGGFVGTIGLLAQSLRTGGIILACGASRAEIERIMAEDPFVSKDLARFEVTEFLPKPAAMVEALQLLLEPRRREA